MVAALNYKARKPRFAALASSPQWDRVTPLTDDSLWLLSALRKIAGLARLAENWDGHGSRPIQRGALQQSAPLLGLLSKSSLPEPQIFPVPGGGIQLEWQNAKCGAELEILPDGAMEFLIVDAAGEMREGSVSSSLEEVYRLINWFVRQKTSIVEF